jgi:hypothetical protein
MEYSNQRDWKMTTLQQQIDTWVKIYTFHKSGYLSHMNHNAHTIITAQAAMIKGLREALQCWPLKELLKEADGCSPNAKLFAEIREQALATHNPEVKEV